MTTAGLRLADSPFLADLGPGERSLWRFVATVAAGVAAYLLVTVVVFLAVVLLYVAVAGWPAPTSLEGLKALLRRFVELGASDGRSFPDAMEIIGLGLTTNIAPMFAVIGLAALIHERPIRGLATTAPRFRWRMMAAGVALWVVVVGPFLLVGQLMDPKAGPAPMLAVSTNPALCLIYALVCIAGFTPAAIGEEILFRGWLLRQTGNLTRNILVLTVANGVIFSTAHLDFAPDAFLERAIMGAGFVYMTLRVGGVELSSGAHTANNLALVLFISPLTLKLTQTTGVSATSIAAYVGLFVAYVAMAELMVRWAPLRRWAGADQTLPPPPAIAAAAHFS
ncbi:MAG TPA: CPBP family intramembrane glutamic endopeptidase [Caulobacteraceae bacterium]|jgi:hypothetical protein